MSIGIRHFDHLAPAYLGESVSSSLFVTVRGLIPSAGHIIQKSAEHTVKHIIKNSIEKVVDPVTGKLLEMAVAELRNHLVKKEESNDVRPLKTGEIEKCSFWHLAVGSKRIGLFEGVYGLIRSSIGKCVPA